MDDVYAELEGLEGEERTARLQELAQAESGDFTVYTFTNERESGQWFESFTEAHGIEVNIYRASATDLMQRLVQEDSADFRDGADVVEIGGKELVTLDEEYGMLLRLDTPVTANLEPSAVGDNWAGYGANAYVVFWNTNNVTSDEVPRKLEEVFSNFEGRLLMEATDWDWMATLITEWFVPVEGMTEEEAVELFRRAAQNAAAVRGHTFMNTQVISGEFDISASSYVNRSQGDVQEGAPVAWEPAVEPLIIRPNGVGIHQHTSRPATSLLYVEHMLDTVQEGLPEQSFIPMKSDVEGSPVADYTVVYMDAERLVDEREKWESIYQDVLQQVGFGMIEESS